MGTGEARAAAHCRRPDGAASPSFVVFVIVGWGEPYYPDVVRMVLFLPMVCSALGVAGPALAQPKVAVDYRVSEGCPAVSEFESALRARGASLAGSRSAPRVRALEVAIEERDGTYRGTLRVHTDDDGRDSSVVSAPVSNESSSSLREVHAATCSEVIKGLAVVGAIALGATPGEEPEGKANGASEGAEAKAGDAAVAPALSSKGRAAEGRAATTEPDAGSRADEPRRLRGNSFNREKEIEVRAGRMYLDRVNDLTLSAGAQFGLVPGVVMPRYDLTLRVTNFVTAPGDASRIVGPTVEVNVNFLSPVTRATDGFDTEAFGFGAAVRACSALTYDNEGLSLHICSEFGLTALHFDTKDSAGKVVQEKETGIGIAGIGGELQYNLGRLFHVNARAAGQLQIGGASADRPDGNALFKVPLFGGYASAGVGMHF